MAFNYKRADFWLPNFGFKRSLLSLLKKFVLNIELPNLGAKLGNIETWSLDNCCCNGNKATILNLLEK